MDEPLTAVDHEANWQLKLADLLQDEDKEAHLVLVLVAEGVHDLTEHQRVVAHELHVEVPEENLTTSQAVGVDEAETAFDEVALVDIVHHSLD